LASGLNAAQPAIRAAAANSSLLRARIKDLPSGVGVTKTASGRGREFWRVRLGKRFTGGPVVKKDFSVEYEFHETSRRRSKSDFQAPSRFGMSLEILRGKKNKA